MYFSVFDDDIEKEADQFGFLRTLSHVALERKYLKSVHSTNKRREKKWTKMLQNYQRAVGKKLPNRVYKGVPNKVRADYWAIVLNIDAVKAHFITIHGDYSTLYKNSLA